MPFKVIHNSRKTLVEQVTDGLRTCIHSGRFTAGDVLPTIRDLAAQLGVSDIVTRAAVKTLTREGLLNPRPKIGIQVLGRRGKTWKGRVLLVTRSDGRTYYVNVFAATLRERLVASGWELAQAVMTSETPDRSELELQLAHPTDLAVVMFDNPKAVLALRRAGVPFIVIGNAGAGKVRNSMGFVAVNRSLASDAFAAHCLASGVRRVWEVGFEDFHDIDEAFGTARVEVDHLTVPVPMSGHRPASVTFAARDFFSDLLRKMGKGVSLPDLIYFSDDHICTGALVALSGAGVRVPEDVGVATWANLGDAPVFINDLTRLEMDPEADASRVAEYCISVSDGSGRMPDPPVLAPYFVSGETVQKISFGKPKGATTK